MAANIEEILFHDRTARKRIKKSPFINARNEVINEKNSSRSRVIKYFRVFIARAKSCFSDYIPVEVVKKLPFRNRIIFGLCCYLIALLILSIFFYRSFQNSKSSFISISSDSGLCHSVAKPLSGALLLRIPISTAHYIFWLLGSFAIHSH